MTRRVLGNGLIAAAVCGLAALPILSSGVAESAVQGSAPEALVRRLTAEQYQNIIADVFGPTIELGGRFEPDMRADGLVAVGASKVSVSPTGLEQYETMARTIAAQIVDEKRRGMMIPCKPAAENAADDACTRQFMVQVGRLLYRRPLTGAELDAYVGAAALGAKLTGNYYDGVGLGLAGMLSSPKFIFRVDVTGSKPDRSGEYQLDSYSKASHLSFFLWNSGPDAELLDAAASGDLTTKRGLARQVERMLASRRLEAGVRAFFIDMFGFDQFSALAKDTTLYPKFSTKSATDAQEQTLKTIIDRVLIERGDYREIFTTRKTYLTQELAAIYKVPLATIQPNGAPDSWEAYEFAPEDPRAGILTHASFTALHSHPGISSPTLRGKALREVIFCQKVPAPPGNVEFDLVNNVAYKTARDRLKAHASEAVCAGCHKITDPAGLALENFDTAGTFRTTENGEPIDTSAVFDGKNIKGPADLGRAAYEHPATTSCLVNRIAAYGRGGVARSDRPWLTELESAFKKSGYRLPELMKAIALSDQFYRPAPVQSAPETSASAPPRLGTVTPVSTERRQ